MLVTVRPRMRTYAAVLGVGAVLVLGGCSGDDTETPSPAIGTSTSDSTTADTTTADTTTAPTTTATPADLETASGRRAPRVQVTTRRSGELSLAVITWGSSSCRFTPTRLEVVDDRLEVVDETPPPQACTLDFRRSVAHPHAVGLDLDDVQQAVVRFNDRPAVVVPIRFGIE